MHLPWLSLNVDNNAASAVLCNALKMHKKLRKKRYRK